ncbi:septal ring lytic transglycosylase RlpA family protein [Caviibacter abscessus]|uniref:septal ring lytic transglycosylase RlpA family protein n=1 Tax=Caviibacter abscessus TaxID=1766719 RepID=UPI000832ADCF|nr:septal ring lytic transglycosylase RlpA family protein [Caviibacter abscessus]
MKKLLIILTCFSLTSSVIFAESDNQISKSSSQSSNVKESIIKEIVDTASIDNDIQKSLEDETKSQPVNVQTEEPEQLVHYENGKASFYGEKWNGRKTSNGEIFDTKLLTAAHKTLPFGTLVKVTNESNGKSVIVRINDRGPFIKGRVIDLTKAAFSAIDSVQKGVTKVKLEIIKK